MLATSLQQWARRYSEVSHHAGRGLKERAQIHSFLASGITKFRVNPMVQALPAMVHLSLFIFFAGLLVYLFNINHAVFSAVACCVALLSAIYGFITFMSFIWLDSPYYSPLTQPAWFLCTRVSYVIMSALHGIMSPFFAFEDHHRIRKWMELCRRQKVRGNLLVFLDAISKQSAEINFRILEWTVFDLYEDDELERVFESIPGFLKSDQVTLDSSQAEVMTENAMSQFLGNTLLSNSVPESVKVRRLTKCLNVARQVLLPVPRTMFHELIKLNWGGAPHSVEIGSSLRTWDEGSNGRFTPYIRGVIAVIIAKVRGRNVPWARFARYNLPTGVPEVVFQDYLTHSDSVLLANLVHFTRHSNRFEPFSIAVVQLLSKFNIRGTLPDLQRDFCVMWNELVQEAQITVEGSDNNTVLLLREIRRHYSALHQGDDAPPRMYLNASGSLAGPLDNPLSYPLCDVHGHRHRSDPKHYAPDVPIAEAAWLLPPPPATSSTPTFSRPEFISTDIAPFSTPLAHPDDTAMEPADSPGIHDMPTPIIQSSYPPPPAMPQPYSNLVAPSGSPVNTSPQPTARRPTISSGLDGPTPVTISIPQPTLSHSTGSATAAVSSSPPMRSMASFPSSPLSRPNSISTPTSSPPFPIPSFSGSTQAPSDQATAIPPVPPVAHQSSSDQDPMPTSSAAKDGAPDKSSV